MDNRIGRTGRVLFITGLGALLPALALGCGGAGTSGMDGEPGALSGGPHETTVHADDAVVDPADGLHADPDDLRPTAPGAPAGDAGTTPFGGGRGTVNVTVDEPTCASTRCSIDLEVHACTADYAYLGGKATTYTAGSLETFAVALTWRGAATMPCTILDVFVENAKETRFWYGRALDEVPLKSGGTSAVTVALRPLLERDRPDAPKAWGESG